jgi:hypothetical protein
MKSIKPDLSRKAKTFKQQEEIASELMRGVKVSRYAYLCAPPKTCPECGNPCENGGGDS